jgi:hypothetical protein
MKRGQWTDGKMAENLTDELQVMLEDYAERNATAEALGVAMFNQLPKDVDKDIAKMAAEQLIDHVMINGRLTHKERKEWCGRLIAMLNGVRQSIDDWEARADVGF